MPWKVDPEASRIEFTVKHLKITTVRGKFLSFEGTIQLDEQRPERSFVEGTVEAATVRTGIGPRDSSLRSAGFLDVKRFPRMSFYSTRIGPFEGDRFKVYGELTIRNVTRQVVFDVVNRGELPTTGGRRRWAFQASTDLKRKDFGLKWNPLMELGEILVSNQVHGLAEIEVVEDEVNQVHTELR